MYSETVVMMFLAESSLTIIHRVACAATRSTRHHATSLPAVSGSEMDSAESADPSAPGDDTSADDGTTAAGASQPRLTARPADLVVKDVAKVAVEGVKKLIPVVKKKAKQF